MDREHKVVMDRPEAKGGQNRGAMGGENLLAAAQSREHDIKDIKLRITGSLASAPPSFTAVEMKIIADYNDKNAMEKLVTIAERGCIVANT
jgi:putative redox protein